MFPKFAPTMENASSLLKGPIDRSARRRRSLNNFTEITIGYPTPCETVQTTEVPRIWKMTACRKRTFFPGILLRSPHWRLSIKFGRSIFRFPGTFRRNKLTISNELIQTSMPTLPYTRILLSYAVFWFYRTRPVLVSNFEPALSVLFIFSPCLRHFFTYFLIYLNRLQGNPRF